MDFGSSMENFQEGAMICRPRDVFGFAIRYFKDEKLPSPEEAHAIHMLPFLVFNHLQLQSTLCTIYCHYTMNGNTPKDWLDSATVWDVYEKMDLGSLKLKIKCIDEAAQGRIMSLKRIDFNLFLACIRFPLSCYQLVIWLQDKLVLLLEESSSLSNISLIARSQQGQMSKPLSPVSSGSVGDGTASLGNMAGVGCLQLQPPQIIELHKIKMCLQKEQQQSNSPPRPTAGGASSSLSHLSKSSQNSYTVGAHSKADRWNRLRSCSYHMHDCLAAVDSTVPSSSSAVAHGCGILLPEADCKSLHQLLVSAVDTLIAAGGPTTIQADVLIEAFVMKYLKKMNFSSSSPGANGHAGSGSPKK